MRSAPPRTFLALVALVALFGATRAVGVTLAERHDVYTVADKGVLGDVHVYAGEAHRVVRGAWPYRDVAIEYPPASLPFVLGPEVTRRVTGDYLHGFLDVMVLVDAAGLAGCLVLARRSGARWGPWLWVVFPALLGPITWTRLDLVPAVATVWALERASARRWGWAGALLGFAVAAKVYPVFLLPAVVFVSPRPRRVLAAAGAAVAVCLAPFVTALGSLWTSVGRYQTHRGLQLETTWANGLLLRSLQGAPARVVIEDRAYSIVAPGAHPLKLVAAALSGLAAVVGTWYAARRVERGDVAHLSLALVALLAVLLLTGSVLSPQYLLWLVALVAAAGSLLPHPRRAFVVCAGLLGVAAVLVHVLFPIAYGALIARHPSAVWLLTARNTALVGFAATAVALCVGMRSAARVQPGVAIAVRALRANVASLEPPQRERAEHREVAELDDDPGYEVR